jgi:hypothetical protein
VIFAGEVTTELLSARIGPAAAAAAGTIIGGK